MKLAVRLFILILLIACMSVPAGAGDVHLSAAASLRDVIGELAKGFARENPGVRFLNNFGGSGILAKQIENGAPCDLFISANREWMDYLRGRKLMDKTSIRPFAGNALVVIGDPAKKIRRIEDLPELSRIAIGSPKSVPAGEYALRALRNAGIDRRLEKKLVMAKDVRECLLYAERGEVDGAFVYRSDALQARSAKVLFTVPQELYPPIAYFMGLTVTGAGNDGAAAWYAYLRGAQGRAILDRQGFDPPLQQ